MSALSKLTSSHSRRVVAAVASQTTAAATAARRCASSSSSSGTARPVRRAGCPPTPPSAWQPPPRHSSAKLVTIGAAAVGAALIGYTYMRRERLHAFTPKRFKDDTEKAVKLTTRERRFIKFASVEFDGQLYMTPQDFLESVVEQDARPRLKRKELVNDDMQMINCLTPPLEKGSSRLFRQLREKGVISYTEYLFLLSVLTKPKSGFRIAFNMFDTDGNQRVDRDEFLVLTNIMSGSLERNETDQATRKLMEKIFIEAWKDKRGIAVSDEVVDSEGLQVLRCHRVNTTLQVHFFGRKGLNELTYDRFYTFMDDLQTEVLELEFSQFSKGQPFITEVDFAKILLRYTFLDADEYDAFLERLLDRMGDDETMGISFQDFRDFCQFLNNLEDFSIAMRMYTLADHPISKDEFSRAVQICTGMKLSAHLIDTVFAIFDEDGDGLLSYKEFIAIMKDRLHRGFKSAAKSEGWDAFKVCLKHEMKAGL